MSLDLKVWIPVMDMMPVSEQFKYHKRLCLLDVSSKHPLQPSHCLVECQVVRFPFVLWGYVKLLVQLMNECLLGKQVKGSSQGDSLYSVGLPDTVALKKCEMLIGNSTRILVFCRSTLVSLVLYTSNSLSKNKFELSVVSSRYLSKLLVSHFWVWLPTAPLNCSSPCDYP